MNSCPIKNKLTYKRVYDVFGKYVTDGIIKTYSKKVKKLPDGQYYYPNLTEIKAFLNTNRSVVIKNISRAIELDKNVPAKGLKLLLTGVVNTFEGVTYITKGNDSTGSLVGDINAIDLIFEPNYMIMKQLAYMYPDRFSIKDTKYKHVKIINITESNNITPAASKTVSEKTYRADDTLREKYLRDGDVQKASKILNKISESSHPLAKLANALSKYSQINDVNLEFYPVEQLIPPRGEIKEAKGYYDPNTKIIRIAEYAKVRNGMSESLLLHEILHAISYDALRNNTKVVDDFTKLYDAVISKLGKFDPNTKNGIYATYTIDEFFVALFTDSKFIIELEKLKPVDNIKYNNILEEIFDHILNILNISKKDQNLYSQAFAVATNILDNENENAIHNKILDDIGYNDFYPGEVDPESININESYFNEKYNSKIRNIPLEDYIEESITFINNMRNFGYSDTEINEQLNCI